jgi:hypothetical protein
MEQDLVFQCEIYFDHVTVKNIANEALVCRNYVLEQVWVAFGLGQIIYKAFILS